MKNHLRLSRRDAIKLMGLASTLAVPSLLQSRAALAAGKRRRHLINVHGFGGWDTAWATSPLLVSETAGLSSADLTSEFYGLIANPRFPDSAAQPFAGGFLGPVMNGFTAGDLSRLLIWRGLEVEGQHGIGNALVQNGHTSSYAASFSTLIADALAMDPDYLRPLHYLQVSETPAQLATQVGLFKGPGVPINVPDYSTWQKISQAPPGDPIQSPTTQQPFDALIAKLATAGEKFALPTSRNVFARDYVATFAASENLMQRNYATAPEFAFQTIWDRYKNAVVQAFTDNIYTSAMLGPEIARVPGYPATAAGVRTFLDQTVNLDTATFPYAMAEFLIKYDLSAVVDIATPFGDFHAFNDTDLVTTSFSLYCWRELIRALGATPVSDVDSRSLLDITLVTLATEFDRELPRTSADPRTVSRPGTDHGITASMLLAGYGTRAGTIIGARGTGPSGSLAGLGAANRFKASVPIDLTTGQPSATGERTTQRSPLPAILHMFGVPIPSQQVTDLKAVTAVVRPGFTT